LSREGRYSSAPHRERPELGRGVDELQAAEGPADERFAEVLESVPGLARPNNLALLNTAAGCARHGGAT